MGQVVQLPQPERFVERDDDIVHLRRMDGRLRTWREIQEAVLDFAILTTGSKAKAAKALKIGRSTLYRKI